MILFAEDWQRYPSAIADFDTRNESFLHYCRLLYDMGVKNWKFPLALFQPELVGVDPFDPDLTEEQMTMIRVECQYNPWYYIREVMRVPPVSGTESVPLRANRANISLWWCFLNHIDYFLIQPRQTGKSLNTDGISNWYQLFGAWNSRANLFTKNGDLIKENIARLKKIRSLLPKYLVNIVPEDTDNQKEFTNYGQGNRMIAVQAQANEDAALNVGRGLTAAYNHIDEVAFLKFVHISVPAMLAGSGAAREQAKRNNQPYGNIFTSTSGKYDTPEGAFAYGLLKDGMPWTEALFDCINQSDLYRMVGAQCHEESAMLINGTFSHRQLGYTDEWLRARIAESKAKGDDVRRDFLNQWTAGTLTNPLSTEILERIRKSVEEPLYEQRYDREGYIVRWYVEFEEVARKLAHRQVIMGFDTSNATGRDSISGVMLDASTLETVGIFTVNESNLQVFSKWFASFLVEYKTITVVPEAKSTWIAILDYLLINLPLMGEDPGKRIYSQIVDRKDDTERDRKEYYDYSQKTNTHNHYGPYRRFFGFPTNGPLRELLYTSIIQEAGKKTGHLVRDKTLSDEIGSLVVKNGRIDHASGRHDDHVISWLLVHWFLTYAKNLDHYGIRVSEVKRKVYEAEHEMTWKELRKKEQQEEYREEIEYILDRMGQRISDMEVMKLEHRLNALYRRLDQDAFTASYGSIDALIQEAAEKRGRTRSMAQSRRESADQRRGLGRSTVRHNPTMGRVVYEY